LSNIIKYKTLGLWDYANFFLKIVKNFTNYKNKKSAKEKNFKKSENILKNLKKI